MTTPEALKELEQPYEPGAHSGPQGIARALGCWSQRSHELYQIILGDLDRNLGGIGWWAPHPSEARRRLIADVLVQSAWSINYNLAELGIHKKEALHWISVEEKTPRAGVARRAPKCPADDLSEILSDLHVSGMARAVGSALDCLGATIVGVLGLPSPIKTTDYEKAQRSLDSQASTKGKSSRWLRVFQHRLRKRVRTTGPEGWLRWALAYRNMFVHRGRRLEMSIVSVKLSPFVNRAGKPYVHSPTVHRHLAAEPNHSEVEAWREPTRSSFLEESPATTLEGLAKSTWALVDETASDLITAWEMRKHNPGLIDQPASQWGDIRLPKTIGFEGYAPGSQPVQRQALQSNSELQARLEAAWLLDGQRHHWQTWTS